MKHNAIAAAICGAACMATLLSSCDKEKTISLPDKLESSKWEAFSIRQPDRLVISSLEFRDATHADYTVTTYDVDENHYADRDKVIEQTKIGFTYTYRKPDITMTPTGEGPALNGSIENFSEYNLMTLKTADGKTFFSAKEGAFFHDWK